MVSEWFPSVFGVFQTCPKTCPGVCPSFFGPQSCPEGCRGLPANLSQAFGPSKLSGVVGGVSGELSQNMKTGVYAEPPVSGWGWFRLV